MIRKTRPRALDRRDRQRTDERVYRTNRQQALSRDGHHCRLCGAHTRLETHHVKARSGFGPKRVTEKHAATNLLTVCADCHKDITEKVVKVIVGERGADGPVEVLRWSDNEQGYVTVRSAA